MQAANTTILHAVEGQRVLTVTGATISNSVVISGLTFTGGDIFNGWQCPEDCGGGIALINGAQPLIQHMIISDNVGVYGGGLYSDNVRDIIQVKFVRKRGILYGGGAFAANAASVSETLFDHNQCGTKGCHGGGLSVGVASSATGTTAITDSVFTANMADNGSAILSFRLTWVMGGQFTNNVCVSYLCGAGTLVVGSGYGNNLSLNVSGVQFIGNSAANSGSGIAGAIYFTGGGTGQIVNSLFAQNQAAEQGAAIFLNWGSDTIILNSTIADVNLNPRSAIAVYAGSTLRMTNTAIDSHTIGIRNTGGTVNEDYNLFFGNLTNTVGVMSGGHSLSGDPRFVDPLHDDYHLQQAPRPSITASMRASTPISTAIRAPSARASTSARMNTKLRRVPSSTCP